MAVTGTTTIVEARVSFGIRVINPCNLPDYVSIKKPPLQQEIIDYILSSAPDKNGLSFEHEPFIVSTFPIEHTLCGTLTYAPTFAGRLLSKETKPISYNAFTKKFTIYTDN